MSQQITGSLGWIAQVGKDLRLWVESKSRPSEEVEAQDGNAFIFHAECHLAAAASGGLMSFKNTDSSVEIVITRIYIDPHTITPTDLIVTQIKNPTVTGGTDVTSTGIIQKKFSIDTTLTGELKISDGAADLALSGGSNYHAFPIVTMDSKTREMKGTNIVTPNKTIAWGWKTRAGGNAADGEIVSMSVNCFKRDVT